jgi:hypothetical protein
MERELSLLEDLVFRVEFERLGFSRSTSFTQAAGVHVT